MTDASTWHGTTILAVRKDNEVVVAGDGQVSLGQTVIKANARKVRRLSDGNVSQVLRVLPPTHSLYLNGWKASWSSIRDS